MSCGDGCHTENLRKPASARHRVPPRPPPCDELHCCATASPNRPSGHSGPHASYPAVLPHSTSGTTRRDSVAARDGSTGKPCPTTPPVDATEPHSPAPSAGGRNVTNPHVSSMLLSGRITRSRGRRCYNRQPRASCNDPSEPLNGALGQGPRAGDRHACPRQPRGADRQMFPAALATRDVGRAFG